MLKIEYSSHFARAYKKIPLSVKKKAETNEALFRKNPFNAKLKTHKLKGRSSGYWAFSANNQYRIIFSFASKNKARFHTIGLHNIYYQGL